MADIRVDPATGDIEGGEESPTTPAPSGTGSLEPFDSYGGLDPVKVPSTRLNLAANLALAAKLPTEVDPNAPTGELANNLRMLVGQQAKLALLDADDVEQRWRDEMAERVEGILQGVGDMTTTRDQLLAYFRVAQRVAATRAIYIRELVVRNQLLAAQGKTDTIGISSRWDAITDRLDAARTYARTGTLEPGDSVQALLTALYVDLPKAIVEERRKGSEVRVLVNEAADPLRQAGHKVGEIFDEAGRQVQKTADSLNTAIIIFAGAAGVAAVVALLLLVSRRRKG